MRGLLVYTLGNVKESFENVNNNIEESVNIEKLRKELLEKFQNYNKTLTYLAADAPISTLCLPKATEALLLKSGCVRIYDLFNMDLTKIKGIGSVRLRHLTTRLDQFVSMF